MRAVFAILLSLGLFGCTQLPDVPEPPNKQNADYPPLVSVGTVFSDSAETDAEARRTEQSVAGRVASLRARAARLRTTSFD